MLCLIELLAYSLLRFLVNGMGITPSAILLQFQLVRRVPLILHRRIVPLLALRAGKRQDFSHVRPSPALSGY